MREQLDGDLSVETLAQVAGFSPFHFHRVFKAMTDETLNELVVRLRLERRGGVIACHATYFRSLMRPLTAVLPQWPPFRVPSKSTLASLPVRGIVKRR